MSETEMIAELTAMPVEKRHETLKMILAQLYPSGQKAIDRMLRRIENPDIPEDVWRGIEEAEDGRLVEMETALSRKPPWLEQAISSQSPKPFGRTSISCLRRKKRRRVGNGISSRQTRLTPAWAPAGFTAFPH